jgi:transglutaminase-like putative cysteine protease
MAWESPEGMDEYLRSTKLCDCDDVKLKGKAKEIIKGAKTPKEAALKVFYFTRNEIYFGIDYPDVKASHTLKKRAGFCVTKTNLQIALLRAVGVPARCHYVHLTKESLKGIIPGFMYNKLPTAIVHSWCECYLAENWVVCEALFDEAFYKGILREGLFTKEQIPTIDWNGETDLISVKSLIVKDVDIFPSWDEGMMEAQKRGEWDSLPPSNRFYGWFLFFLANRHINKIRKP